MNIELDSSASSNKKKQQMNLCPICSSLIDINFQLTIKELPNNLTESPTDAEIKIITDTNKVIGKCELYIFNAIEANTFHETIDDLSVAYTYGYTKDIRGKSAYKQIRFDEFYRFIIIHTIGIDEEFRKMGIFLRLIKSLTEFFTDSVFLVKAYPMKYENQDVKNIPNIDEKSSNFLASRKKIINHYKKAGFSEISRGSEFLYMINE